MSEDIRNAQYIQIPESGAIYKFLGTIWRQYNPMVDKITDSNGNVIWGRPSKYTYRKLEYIHFNGIDNYIDTGIAPAGSKCYIVIYKQDSNVSHNARVVGAYDWNASSGAARRCYLCVNSDGKFQFAIGNTWSTAAEVTGYSYQKVLQYATLSSDRKTLWCSVRDPETYNTLLSDTITTTTAIGTSVNIALGTNLTSSGYDTNNIFKGNMYRFEIKETNFSGNIINQWIPVQRKSDSAIGFYDTKTSTFHKLQGTTTSAAGPIVDEYWDMTA